MGVRGGRRNSERGVSNMNLMKGGAGGDASSGSGAEPQIFFVSQGVLVSKRLISHAYSNGICPYTCVPMHTSMTSYIPGSGAVPQKLERFHTILAISKSKSFKNRQMLDFNVLKQRI